MGLCVFVLPVALFVNLVWGCVLHVNSVVLVDCLCCFLVVLVCGAVDGCFAYRLSLLWLLVFVFVVLVAIACSLVYLLVGYRLLVYDGLVDWLCGCVNSVVAVFMGWIA